MTVERDERRERGAALFEEIMRIPAPPADAPGPPMVEDGLLRSLFAEVWSRPGLTRKERRLITVTAVAGSAVPGAVAAHVRAALESGDLTVAELNELILHYAYYAGFPRASALTTALMEYLAAQENPGLVAGRSHDREEEHTIRCPDRACGCDPPAGARERPPQPISALHDGREAGSSSAAMCASTAGPSRAGQVSPKATFSRSCICT